MAADPFLDEDFRVLTPEAFDFVLNNELKRALRSQNYLTLVLVEPQTGAEDRPQAVRQVARLVSRELRETDLLTTADGALAMVLLDADLANSLRVIDRLLNRLQHYEFPTPLALEVGAACCPIHGADAATLRRVAERHRADPRRTPRGNASSAQ